MPRARGASPIDVEVGKRIRVYRKKARLSQTELAKALKLTFQQVQKYEMAPIGLRRAALKLSHIRAVCPFRRLCRAWTTKKVTTAHYPSPSCNFTARKICLPHMARSKAKMSAMHLSYSRKFWPVELEFGASAVRIGHRGTAGLFVTCRSIEMRANIPSTRRLDPVAGP